MFTANSNRVSPVPLIPAEVIEMDPAYPPAGAGGQPTSGFEMNDPVEGAEVPRYAPQQEYPAVGIGEYCNESSSIFSAVQTVGGRNQMCNDQIRLFLLYNS